MNYDNAGQGSTKSAPTAAELTKDLERARTLATLLDAQFSLFGVRFGLDGVIGLIPAVGDTITAAAALYPLYVAHKHDLGKDVVARMGINVAVDYLAGLVPFFGDIVDVAFKANLANYALLVRAAEAKEMR
jgi:hypothetical protein